MVQHIRVVKSIVVIGTLDTKGHEVDYVRNKIEEQGFRTIVIDVGVLGKPLIEAAYPRNQVAELGGKTLKDLIKSAKHGSDRADATLVMVRGAIKIIGGLLSQNRLHGIIAVGGSTGTTIGISTMQTLPIGIPKLMVSTNLRHSREAGEKDITVMQTPADLIGPNKIMRRTLAQAACAVVGMVKAVTKDVRFDERPMVGMTALGVTTPAVMQIIPQLEESGWEVIVFHNRTRTLEELLMAGQIKGIIDLSPSELVRAYIRKEFSERKTRFDILSTLSVPMVIAPGSLDMIILSHFNSGKNIQKQYKDRITSKHGPYVTLVRTTLREIRKLGTIIAQKANAAKGPVAILIPLKGFSSMDKEGQPFYDPVLTKAFVKSVKGSAKEHVRVMEVDSHINDNEFAQKVCNVFTNMVEEKHDEESDS